MYSTSCYCGHQIRTPLIAEKDSLFYCNDKTIQVSSNYDKSMLQGLNSDEVLPSTLTHQDIICHSCVVCLLASQLSRHKAAIELHQMKRNECQHRLLASRLSPSSSMPDPNLISQRTSQLRDRLNFLRRISNELSIRLTSKTIENDEREERLQMNTAKVLLARDRLESMRRNMLLKSTNQPWREKESTSEDTKQENKGFDLRYQDSLKIGGGIRDAFVSGTQHIQHLRFYFALRVFEMHRIDVGEKYSNKESNEKTAEKKNLVSNVSGIGKIVGLPLPHAGPALYGVLPSGVLASSLRLVASVTSLVARCLGVVLPHPIMVSAKECERCGAACNFDGDVIDVTTDSEFCNGELKKRENLCSACEHDYFKNLSGLNSYPNIPGSNKKSNSNSQSLYPTISTNHNQCLANAPKSSILTFVGTSARKAIALATGSSAFSTSSATTATRLSSNHASTLSKQLLSTQPTSSSTWATSSATTFRRINRASFAVLLENNEAGAAEYVLNPPRWKEGGKGIDQSAQDGHYPLINCSDEHKVSISKASTAILSSQPQSNLFSNREEFHLAEERFATGLQLLQNDVIALCFCAGVDASKLWPAESLLLNLYALFCHCQKMMEMDIN